MDLKQLEYILKIEEEKNITKAAQKLFVTQSALNQQLLRLEKELGTLLFYRSRSNCTPTPAGEIYLKAAREIIQIKRQTYNQIHDLATIKKGHLSIGFTAGRGIAMFKSVYPAFHRQYPNLIVEPREISVRQQQQEIANGTLDIGFMTLREKDRSPDTYYTLCKEEMVLIVPMVLPIASKAAPIGEPLSTIDISLLKYEPFVLMYKESTNRKMVDSIFQEAHFIPNILFETSSAETIVTMVQANLCCGIVPAYYIKNQSDSMACFTFESHPTWDICVSYKTGAYLSKAAKEFIRLASEYWIHMSSCLPINHH